MRKRILIGTGIALLMFVAYFAWQYFQPSAPIFVSAETTVIIAPLADDDLPNYSAYLLGKMKEGVPPEDNGAIPFLKAMWPAGLEPEEQAIVCEELRMEMPVKEGLRLPFEDEALTDELAKWLGIKRITQEQVDSGEWIDEYREDEFDYLGALIYSVWTREQAPCVAEWLDRHSASFDLLHDSAEYPRFYFPSPELLTHPKEGLWSLRSRDILAAGDASTLLQLRANLRVGSDDLTAAWTDCRALYQFADIATHPFEYNELQSSNLTERADSTTLHILGSPGLTSDLAGEIATFLDNRSPQHNMRTVLKEGERLAFAGYLLNFAHARTRPGADKSPLRDDPRRWLSHFDWSEVLRLSLLQYDALLDAMDQPTHKQRRAAIAEWCSSLERFDWEHPESFNQVTLTLSRGARNELMAKFACRPLLGYVSSIDIENRRLIERTLQKVAVALSRFRLKSEKYPETLSELVPGYLNELPVDLFDNEIAYKRTFNGYLLYSLGDDGQDQNGSNEKHFTLEGYPRGYDEVSDRQLRKALGMEPPPLHVDGEYELLSPPKNSDDIAIRLPLLHRPLPKFNPAAE